MEYTIQDIAAVVSQVNFLPQPFLAVKHLLTDSRKLIFPESTLFIALKTDRKNGGVYVKELYEEGVRNFIVDNKFDQSAYAYGNFIFCPDPLKALQQIATWHRAQFNIPVVGVTGSNGKTIVKEWLYHLLNEDYNIVRSPKSYNSQIGVPVSVWQMNNEHTLAIFEAGISQPGEMEVLQDIIKPTIGIFTNIGEAHNAGFADNKQKAVEKLKLFKDSKVLFYNNNEQVLTSLKSTISAAKTFTWGDNNSDLCILNVEKSKHGCTISARYKIRLVSIQIPFTDNASIQNAIICWSVLLYLAIPDHIIDTRMQQLQPVEMRLEFKKAINGCSIINDSYSNDYSSLQIALDFLQQQAGNQPATVILSDIGGAANNENDLYAKVAEAIREHKINRFVGIGPKLVKHQEKFVESSDSRYLFFNSVDDFKEKFSTSKFKDEVILLKGARTFEFERISLLFEQKVHQTVLEVNLTAMVHNLKEYQRCLKPSVKVMAMVKAFSYGSGSAEVASVLQYHKVDYLAVAYADEGVELRKAGIQMPIMVMNPEVVTFDALINYNLEPELYSFNILHAFYEFLKQQELRKFPVHLKLDTGMHRLGFEGDEIPELAKVLTQMPTLVIKSVFSHLVASENETHDAFTQQQTKYFIEYCDQMESTLGYSFIRHISNSAAIFRHPYLQFDMVRLGIGLYGVDSTAERQINLQTVVTLRSTIAQVRKVAAGESIGYSRKGLLEKDSVIATVRIGYADGFSRKLGNGVGAMLLKGKLAPVAGNVCMDMTMLDITDIEDVNEGDEVEIFGAGLPVTKIAEWAETISYEVMTSVSQRVKRVYFEE